MTGTKNWEIDVQNENCNQWTTCTKRLSIILGKYRIVAVGNSVTVDGVTLNSTSGYVKGRKSIIVIYF